MIINTKIRNIVVSVLKKNNKVSLGLMKVEIDEYGKKGNQMIKADSLFPFSVPLITESSVRFYEFIIEANNFAERYQENQDKDLINKI